MRTRRFVAAHAAAHRSAPLLPPLAERRRRHRSDVPRAGLAPSADRRALRHFGVDERIHAPAPAFPSCARRAAAGDDLSVRHAADQRHARAARARSSTRRSARCSAQVDDWSGGTRIGASLRRFNREWSRRVLGQGAIVLLFTDGLERDGVEDARPGNGAAAQVLPSADLGQPAACATTNSPPRRAACARCCPSSTNSGRSTIWRAWPNCAARCRRAERRRRRPEGYGCGGRPTSPALAGGRRPGVTAPALRLSLAQRRPGRHLSPTGPAEVSREET